VLKMRVCNRWSAFVAILALCALPGCTNNDLDDGDSANAIMEVAQLSAPKVSGNVTTGTCTNSNLTCLSDANCDPNDPQDTCFIDPAGAECEIVDWTATLRNAPKTPLNAAPYADMIVQSVTVSYNWFNGFVSPPRTFSLGGTIEPGSTLAVQFKPLTAEDLEDLRAFAPSQERSANVTLVFRGVLVDGDPVSATAGQLLLVEACN
jgi:hypothetical protein